MRKQKNLLLMCNWLGDTFWAMQVIPAIKKEYPNTEIWVGVKPHSKDLLYGLIDKNRVIELNSVISDRHREKFSFKEYLSDIRKIKKEKFDLAIDLTGNRYSALFIFLSRIKKRIGLNLHKLSYLYTSKGKKFNNSKHLINKPFETVSLLFDIDISQKLIPAKTYLSIADLQNGLKISLNDKLALLMPGAGWKEKEWDTVNFVQCGQLLHQKNYKVIVAGAEKERKLCTDISELIDGSIIFIRSLKELIALIPYIDLAVTNDSGPAHLLAAYDVKMITIFCAGTEPDKCGPIGKRVKIHQVEDQYSGLDKVLVTINNMVNL